MTAPNIQFRAKLIDSMPAGEWMTTGDIALRVGAADYATQNALGALQRGGMVRTKRLSDGRRVWRSKDRS